jgi:hypothetical protein
MTTVSGKVLKVNHKDFNGVKFTELVMTLNSNEFKLVSGHKINIFPNDYIIVEAEQKGPGLYFMINEPLVEPGTDPLSMQNVLYIASGYKINKKQCVDLYEDLHKISMQDNCTVVQVINGMVEDLIKTESATLAIERLDVKLSEFIIKKILIWWKSNYLTRKLTMLGVPMVEIDKAKPRWTLTEMYKQAVTNPYLVRQFSMTTCQNICNKINVDPKQWGTDFSACSIVVRAYDDKCDKKGIVCMDVSKCPELTDNTIQNIIQHYKYEMRGPYLYSPESARDEDIIINTMVQSINPIQLMVRVKTMQSLNIDQKQAMELICSAERCLIHGGPGSGKTTLISKLLGDLKFYGVKYAVCAFTGKAVSRIRKMLGSGYRCFTINMLIIKLLKGELGTLNMLIIDEASMVHHSLAAELFKVLDPDCRIVIIGDHHQLQPIGAGDLFGQLLNSKIPKYELKINCRQSDNNLKIVIQDIMNKEYESADTLLDQDISYRLIPRSDISIDEVEQHVIRHKQEGYHSMEITVICPKNEPLAQINNICRDIFVQTDQQVYDTNGRLWKVGDRVMMKTNCYDIDVMNGEEGYITKIDETVISVMFQSEVLMSASWTKDRESIYPRTELLELSWAVTIHKSQGSEWDCVIIYLPPGCKADNFCSQNMLFTALSRAKKSLTIIGGNKSLWLNMIARPADPRWDYLTENINKHLFSDTQLQGQGSSD